MGKKVVKTEFVGVRIDSETVSRLDQLAQQAGGNRSEVIRQLVNQASTTGQSTQQQPQKVSC